MGSVPNYLDDDDDGDDDDDDDDDDDGMPHRRHIGGMHR